MTATVGILPSLVIVTLLAYLYYKYRGLSLMQGLFRRAFRPAVVALIASAGVTIFSVAALNGSFDLKNVNFLGLALFAAALLLLRKWKWNPVLTMALCGGIYLLVGVLFPGWAPV